MAGEGGHTEVGWHFPGRNILFLAWEHKHNLVQHKHRDEVEKKAWTAVGDQDCQRPLKPSDTFPERSRRKNGT